MLFSIFIVCLFLTMIKIFPYKRNAKFVHVIFQCSGVTKFCCVPFWRESLSILYVWVYQGTYQNMAHIIVALDGNLCVFVQFKSTLCVFNKNLPVASHTHITLHYIDNEMNACAYQMQRRRKRKQPPLIDYMSFAHTHTHTITNTHKNAKLNINSSPYPHVF